MAGNVRRDFKSNVTHVVANVIGGEKYEVSKLFLARLFGRNSPAIIMTLAVLSLCRNFNVAHYYSNILNSITMKLEVLAYHGMMHLLDKGHNS
jgi:hypothetical protein